MNQSTGAPSFALLRTVEYERTRPAYSRPESTLNRTPSKVISVFICLVDFLRRFPFLSHVRALRMSRSRRIAASATEVERGTHGSVRPNHVPGVSIRAGGGHLHHWFNTAAFSTEFAPGQLYGTAARNSIPGPGAENVNMSLSRIFHPGEGKSLELRATANNALNIVQYAGVNTQFDSTSNSQVDAFQPMRRITLLARFSF
jgi:hypothetical protein